MKKILTILLVLGCSFLLLTCNKQTPNEPDVSGSFGPAIAQLQKGVNLSNWFNDFSDKNQFANRFSTAHFNQIKDAGFTYVRLPIGPAVLCNPSNIAEVQPANLAFVNQAVKNIVNAGLSVVIDIHAYGSNFEARLATDPLSRAAFRQFWKSLANNFKLYDTTQVFFELWNEPHIGAMQLVAGLDKNWWSPFQGQLIQSIREATPNHYIIASAENYSHWFDLTQLQPYNQKNIIYNFHLYEPFTFTHQYASWLGSPYAAIQSLPYPGTPQNVTALVANATTPEVKYQIEWYGNQKFGLDSINRILQQVHNWSVQKNVPVICDEFGVHKVAAPAADRLRYFTDMRTTFNKYKIGWGAWDYDENFGMASYPNGTRTGLPVWDNGLLSALGLK